MFFRYFHLRNCVLHRSHKVPCRVQIFIFCTLRSVWHNACMHSQCSNMLLNSRIKPTSYSSKYLLEIWIFASFCIKSSKAQNELWENEKKQRPLCLLILPLSKKVTPPISVELNPDLSRNTPIYHGSDGACECLGKDKLIDPCGMIPGTGPTELLFFQGLVWLHFSIAVSDGQENQRPISTIILVFCEQQRRNLRPNNRGYFRMLAKSA